MRSQVQASGGLSPRAKSAEGACVLHAMHISPRSSHPHALFLSAWCSSCPGTKIPTLIWRHGLVPDFLKLSKRSHNGPALASTLVCVCVCVYTFSCTCYRNILDSRAWAISWPWKAILNKLKLGYSHGASKRKQHWFYYPSKGCTR